VRGCQFAHFLPELEGGEVDLAELLVVVLLEGGWGAVGGAFPAAREEVGSSLLGRVIAQLQQFLRHAEEVRNITI
jgi:hypothetical protein